MKPQAKANHCSKCGRALAVEPISLSAHDRLHRAIFGAACFILGAALAWDTGPDRGESVLAPDAAIAAYHLEDSRAVALAERAESMPGRMVGYQQRETCFATLWAGGSAGEYAACIEERTGEPPPPEALQAALLLDETSPAYPARSGLGPFLVGTGALVEPDRRAEWGAGALLLALVIAMAINARALRNMGRAESMPGRMVRHRESSR